MTRLTKRFASNVEKAIVQLMRKEMEDTEVQIATINPLPLSTPVHSVRALTVETIPQDHHKFRNVYPQSAIKDVKQYQDSLWDIKV